MSLMRVLFAGTALLCAFLSPATSRQNNEVAALSLPTANKVTVFIEALSNNNANLLLDRGDLVLSRGSSRERNRLITDLHAMQKLVTSSSEKLPTNGADPKESPPQRLDVALKNLYVSLLAVEVAVGEGSTPPTDAKRLSLAWADCNTAFQKVISAAVKIPGFALSDLGGPSLYNLSPGLYEGREGMVLADPKSPGRTKIGRTFGDAGLKLRKGDEIIALRTADEKDWTPIKTWKDVVNADKQAEEDGEDEALRIVLRVKRGRSLVDVPARFVKRRIEWE